MKKKQIGLFLIASIASIFYISTAFASSPVGHWTTVDDRTGKKRSEVYLSLNHHEL